MQEDTPQVAPPPGERPAQNQPLDSVESRKHVFLTAVEASQLFRLDESTMYRHLRAGTFPGVKIGGRYVVPRAVVDRLISDVLATGRCIDLGRWTERWRAAQADVLEKLNQSTRDSSSGAA
jgi:excisionase family DNA binding protein